MESGYDRISIAPMLDITDTFQRYFMRQLTRKCTLYSEMVVAETILFSRYTDDIIDFDKSEHPLVAQLGGNNPDYLAKAAEILQKKGYDEINLNCGCPSNMVSEHSFGAVLMLEPEKVKECVLAMKQKVSIPITIKCRIGVDDHDSYDELCQFISIVSGCKRCDNDNECVGEVVEEMIDNQQSEPIVQHFIIHARKCILKGLNTKDNRRIPELHYDWVFRLLDSFPQLDFTLNGGISSFQQMHDLLDQQSPIRKRKLRGVMIGRMAAQNPWLFRHADECFYRINGPHLTRRQIVMNYVDYVESFQKSHHQWKPPVAQLCKPLSTLFNGVLRGGSVFRKVLQEKLCKKKLPFRQAVEESLRCFDDAILDEIDYFSQDNLKEYFVATE